MSRSRWFVLGFLLAAVLSFAVVVLEARGPFDAHPAQAYDDFLASYQAGRVEQIVQWRDHLEVTQEGVLVSVVVPPDRDLPSDLATARVAGGVGINLARVPDPWMWSRTPWVPMLLALAAIILVAGVVVRGRRPAPGVDRAGRPQPVG